MYACLAVTCHLHFWQNDRDFLRATVVTRGWNGYRNKSQHRKSTLEKKILPPFQQGFEPATFQSRVRCSNHWAIPAPPTQIISDVCFIAHHVTYASSNKTQIVWIEMELFSFLFFTRGGCVSCFRACFGARLLPQSYQCSNLSEGADRVGGQLRGDKECPFTGVNKSGRVWRKVPESDARGSVTTHRNIEWPQCYISKTITHKRSYPSFSKLSTAVSEMSFSKLSTAVSEMSFSKLSTVVSEKSFSKLSTAVSEMSFGRFSTVVSLKELLQTLYCRVRNELLQTLYCRVQNELRRTLYCRVRNELLQTLYCRVQNELRRTLYCRVRNEPRQTLYCRIRHETSNQPHDAWQREQNYTDALWSNRQAWEMGQNYSDAWLQRL